MHPTTTLISLLLCLILLPTAHAQRINFDKEKLIFLAEVDKVNVVFTYNAPLYNGDNLTEEQFLTYIKAKIVEHANTYLAQEFTLEFNAAKYDRWPNEFVDTINEWAAAYENAPLFVYNDESAPYTMRVNTTWMYFGYDIEIIDRPAKVSMDIEFFKTDSPTEIIETTEISRAMGTYNKQEGDGEIWPKPSLGRVAKAYRWGGYKFAKAIKRIVD